MDGRRQTLIGSSEELHRVLQQVSQVAPLNRPVLIIGERGTGKELIAERLHYLSSRWEQPYLQVNCAAMSETLLESELFGHDAGAFTGATRGRAGLFERADGGTLFLDELATASMQVQEKLLRVIEYGRFERLGGNKTLHVDVRVVAATNADLPTMAAGGRFRGDLLDRLAFDVISLPPLRFRKDDIRELAEHFALKMSIELGYDWFAGFAPEAMTQLMNYHWPGNVRELKNVVERSVYRHGAQEQVLREVVIDPFDSPWRPSGLVEEAKPVEPKTMQPEPDSIAEAESLDLRTRMAQFEQRLIAEALAANQFHQKRAADALGLTYHQLRAALRKYPQLLDGDNASKS
ncbi:psp operon transcription activator PspF (sigma 54-dependent) [Hahella chejuensis KCTC 2396]|uniref:Psp operon transcription activator PspF (Sigma 54-dependent) n=1 Tax=Hahella chejuensis (strain KCTC 2396) TaxID=349521 RepID=Q2SB67_HAHCH|nr:phage shock protein operon transcriptional activator [Hahella chejuensis]ABC32107.1 psp operon transcription activator PspF (sigma 54-dependent) [Hahella chejuensis KCTC 2396]